MMRQRSTGTAQIETRTTTRHGMIGADAATTDQNQSVTKCVFYHFLMCRWSHRAFPLRHRIISVDSRVSLVLQLRIST
jgi:hypothetical protein